MPGRRSDEHEHPSSPAITASPTPATQNVATRNRGSSGASGRLRSASMRFMESSPPLGMWQATGESVAQAPSLADIRRGSFGSSGWDGEGQRRNSVIGEEGGRMLSRSSSGPVSPSLSIKANPMAETVHEEDLSPMVFSRGKMTDQVYTKGAPTSSSTPVKAPPVTTSHSRGTPKLGYETSPSTSSPVQSEKNQGPDADGIYPNGYKFPPKHTWGQSTVIGLKGLWRFTLTPLGFFVVVYGLNVIAWGGMLFLLLCGAGPAMCYPGNRPGVKDCNDINSPRRKWIEVDSQILTALFCVTGFGLIPWRFRDLYYLMRYRFKGDYNALRRLAGYNKSWFRLPGSENLPLVSRGDGSMTDHLDSAAGEPLDETNRAIPIPASKTPEVPLTGVRAPPTKIWKLDFVIWMYIWNTIFQAVLSGIMWGLNRFNRPSWSTGTFVALGCIVAGIGGLMCFFEGKKVKKVEGVPVSEADKIRNLEDGLGEKKKMKQRG
ncbi:MAG: hypothetical protein LQ347_005241 [Umbilicaria vellea]|nr:MAG: hypothetical protein LQ347_005241 [Umbilicaria vellea]